MISTIFSLLLTGICLYVVITSDHTKEKWFKTWYNWHPLFMSIVFLGGMANLIYLLRKDPIGYGKFLVPANKATAKTIHVYGMMVAVTFMIAGFAAIFYNRIVEEEAHFNTWHGKFGLMTVTMVLIQVLLGLPIRFPKIGYVVYGGRQGILKKSQVNRIGLWSKPKSWKFLSTLETFLF